MDIRKVGVDIGVLGGGTQGLDDIEEGTGEQVKKQEREQKQI